MHAQVRCVPDPTSLGTGAVRNATGSRHPSHTMLHRKIKPVPRKENVGTHRSNGSRALGHRHKRISPLPPTLFRPSILARLLSRLYDEAQLRTDLKPRGLQRSRVCLTRPNLTRRHQVTNMLAMGGFIVGHPRLAATPGERLGQGSLPVPILHDPPTQTAYPFRFHLGTN
ncbi:hypothetical protein HPB51_004682 [Rhipicephalus microplus]|uniref:Uncharacterized protein n=1 Tax=Rhipicephalus microplus TaxID=6941 RepID=A0A9J6DZF4_RHIMP|nr:hypothetical protein HPB51_004682 [Rhipicephalus microplus]